MAWYSPGCKAWKKYGQKQKYCFDRNIFASGQAKPSCIHRPERSVVKEVKMVLELLSLATVRVCDMYKILRMDLLYLVYYRRDEVKACKRAVREIIKQTDIDSDLKRQVRKDLSLG